MSKWISKDLFDEFQKEKIEEKDAPSTGGYIRSNLIWETPEKGTTEQAKVYEGRFLPPPEGKFYETYLYHFWQSGETWKFVFCPKTYDYKAFCPICAAVSKLYSGNKDDKKQASLLKKKVKNVANFFIKKDHRDDDRDDENKVIGKVKLYEFPAKIEQKLKKEITDKKEGYGSQIFDPGEDGRDFIIKVLSTKKQSDGRTWPDYSNSGFSRSQEALGSDSEIKSILDTCVNLKEYVKSMETDKDKIVEILKSEFLWDIVEKECIKHGYSDVETGEGEREKKEEEREETISETSTEENTSDSEIEEDTSSSNDVDVDVDVDDLDDDDLLKELDSM